MMERWAEINVDASTYTSKSFVQETAE